MIEFIDVSRYQGTVNWAAYVKAGYQVAVIRAYNGYDKDPFFDANRSGAHAAGIKALGIYSPPAPEDDAADSARKTMAITGAFKSNEFPCLDIESFSGREQPNYAARVHDWLGVVSKAVPHALAWVYSDSSHWQSSINMSAVGNRVKWVARYGATPQVPWDVWQYTSSGSVSGVAGAVDLSKYLGTIDEFMAMVFGRVVPLGDPLLEELMSYYANKAAFEADLAKIIATKVHQVLSTDTVVGAAAYGPKFHLNAVASAVKALKAAGFVSKP